MRFIISSLLFLAIYTRKDSQRKFRWSKIGTQNKRCLGVVSPRLGDYPATIFFNFQNGRCSGTPQKKKTLPPTVSIWIDFFFSQAVDHCFIYESRLSFIFPPMCPLPKASLRDRKNKRNNIVKNIFFSQYFESNIDYI